jgi:VWFA-related protein
MKGAVVLGLAAQIAVSAFASSRVTVDQLNNVIAAGQRESDSKIASRLTAMELSERLNASMLAAMESALPGPESRRALVMLADQAAFLDPPSTEIPKIPQPSFAEQRAIIAKAIAYVTAMEGRLPNLFAQRETIHFEDNPAGLKLGSLGKFNPAQPLHPVSRTEVTVLYRNGKDLIQIDGKEQSASNLTAIGLSSFGEFGQILSTVLVDLPQGNLAWSHWEQGTAKPVAVFGFRVPKAVSHYAVRFCCVGMRPFQQFSGYHGEMTINPGDGTILRVTILADIAKDEPMTKADLMVEYRPVDLGGKTYYCPARSIAISLAMDQAASRGAMNIGTGTVNYQALAMAEAPKQLMLNEVVFDHYHLFTSESRLLTTESSTPPPLSDGNNTTNTAAPLASPPIAVTPATETIATSAIPAETSATGTGSATASTPITAAVASATTTTATTAPSQAPSATPEILVTPRQVPAVPEGPQATFSLRLTTRVVEVNIAAFDKKGQPIVDLKPEDFEIYDSGQKRNLSSFSRAATSSAPPQTSVAAAQPVEYANQSDASAGPAGETTAESSTIIFFDATSLQFNDLTNARQQVLKILGTLPPTEPVGLYVRIGFGFRVLLEATTDRPAMTAAIDAWKPDARDVARAQEAEARNRQQFDTLRTPAAVMSTYAMVGGAGGGGMIGSDPRLFNLGEEPTRQALSVLVAVAAHMGAISGHKNLVWIANDNVLADWSDQSADGDEGRMSPNSIGTFSIRTQEALNNAHVSLYAFDASQLETDATDASLQNAGVELDSSNNLNPNFKAPPGGRSLTNLRTRTHTVQIAIQHLAESTGGRAFGRSSNVVSNLNRVIQDSKAIYTLSFAPITQPDDKYHQLKVTVPGRRDIVLRYRTGYLYNKEPATLKERFAQVLWQPFDSHEIALTARRSPATGGAAVALNIAANDIDLKQQGDRWTGKLDVFLVQRDDTGAGALIKEQTLALDLSPASHDKIMSGGIPFEQYLDNKQNASSVRLIVVDENSGRVGSLTISPATGSTNP